jgi:molecular chaperone HtpG
MKEGQDKIYYITADTFAAGKNSPHLEIFRKKGVEVLLLTDRVDEWVVGSLNEFRGQTAAVGGEGDLDLGKLEDEAEKKEQEQEAEQFKDLTTRIKEALGEKVQEVRITHRLTGLAGLSGLRSIWDEHESGAPAQGRRTEGWRQQADPRG